MSKPSFSFNVSIPPVKSRFSTLPPSLTPTEEPKTIPASKGASRSRVTVEPTTSDTATTPFPKDDFNKKRVALIWKRIKQTGIFEDLQPQEKEEMLRRLDSWFYVTYVNSRDPEKRDEAVYLTADDLANEFIKQEQAHREALSRINKGYSR
jgi:hypothetical protein